MGNGESGRVGVKIDAKKIRNNNIIYKSNDTDKFYTQHASLVSCLAVQCYVGRSVLQQHVHCTLNCFVRVFNRKIGR